MDINGLNVQLHTTHLQPSRKERRMLISKVRKAKLDKTVPTDGIKERIIALPDVKILKMRFASRTKRKKPLNFRYENDLSKCNKCNKFYDLETIDHAKFDCPAMNTGDDPALKMRMKRGDEQVFRGLVKYYGVWHRAKRKKLDSGCEAEPSLEGPDGISIMNYGADSGGSSG